jgi:hypothetical protein
MANWYGLSRTNTFKVKDEAAFRAWANTLSEVELFEDNKGCFGFYTTGDGQWPACRYQEEGDVWSEMDFAEELAAHLAKDEVAVLITVGHEKARYGTGYALAIRSDGKALAVNIDDIYAKVRRKWGKEPTRAEY